jgi:hypothetical protein
MTFLIILIILISLIIILSLILLYKSPEVFENDIDFNKYFIVCARYNKDVSFLDNIPIKNIVLQKGIKPGEIINKANEATSYLYYIINNYDKLPDNIIFTHDEDESWHHDGKISENIYKWIKYYEDNKLEYYNFNNYITNWKEVDMDKNVIIYKDGTEESVNWFSIYKKFYMETLKPYNIILKTKHFPSIGCAQFIVSKKAIQNNPKEMYKNIYKWLIDNTQGEGNGNPDNLHSGYYTGRYLEWSWHFIFDK